MHRKGEGGKQQVWISGEGSACKFTYLWLPSAKSHVSAVNNGSKVCKVLPAQRHINGTKSLNVDSL